MDTLLSLPSPRRAAIVIGVIRRDRTYRYDITSKRPFTKDRVEGCHFVVTALPRGGHVVNPESDQILVLSFLDPQDRSANTLPF
jgi:hypothetical protein